MNSPTAKRLAVETAKFLAGLPQRPSIDALESLTAEEFWAYQGRRLTARYEDLCQHVPWYAARDLYPSQLPSDMQTMEQVLDTLSQLPLLPKESVKRDPAQFYRRPKGLLTAHHTTGGTSGTPLSVRAGLTQRGTTNAILEQRYKATTGKRRPRMLRLSGFLDNTGDVGLLIPGTSTAYLSIYALNAHNKAAVVEFIQHFRPDAIHGYASALHQLAQLVTSSEIGNDLRAIYSTSETLHEHERALIEERLETTVFNEYGSQEGQHLVLECSHRGLHIHPARGIVEILDMATDSPVAIGEMGRVVVTGLTTREMPLVRYSIGDTAYSTGYRSDCRCGSKWPTIGPILGRVEDLVKTEDGRRIGLLSHSTLKDLDGIIESQIVQRSFREFTYRLRVAPRADTRAIERHVRDQLESRVGPNLTIQFDYLDRPLPRSDAGKLKAVVVDF